MSRRIHPYDPHISNSFFARLLVFSCRHSLPLFGRIYRGYLNCDIAMKLPASIFFPHPYGIVISAVATLGEDVVIGQQVTIGNRNGSIGAPRIGNRVYIGAGAKVLGPVVIGENVIIGANAVITKDVPSGMVAVGANRLLPNKGSYWRGKA
jgi:serine acetyltransferase